MTAGLKKSNFRANEDLKARRDGRRLRSKDSASSPIYLPIVAILTFLVLYRGFALTAVTAFERIYQTDLAKPNLKAGIIWSAISPFLVCVLAPCRK